MITKRLVIARVWYYKITLIICVTVGENDHKGMLGKLGKFHVQVRSGNVHASDCGSAHSNGYVVNSISARTAC